ncbi:sulfite exporter TauE/SafE family protein [Pleurocapsa sp. PCC 7319]|uniref:sulfite exporter TauE/SafE family protein n=1 Tax=Pleurocapsa sp. PCC 7319 TaxID=118161 RepID=UPI000347F109|nr:sulfite exporter TauE/SafE family protein [Pleurocapsa sp. PCC 7319]
MESWLIFGIGGIFSGILAGLLGIGGGFVIVSLLVTLGYPPIQAVATSSFVIIMSSSTGSFYNWRMGYLDLQRVVYLALPAIITAQLGVLVGVNIPEYILLTIFSIFLLVNLFLIRLRKKLAVQEQQSTKLFTPITAKITTGGIAGFLSGLLGIGGGTIMVPLQMLLLNEEIKVAIQTSLGVIVTATISSCIVHATQGNILFFQGIMLGIGGMLGSQVGTRVLPKLPDSVVRKIFSLFIVMMAVLNFWQAWKSYSS